MVVAAGSGISLSFHPSKSVSPSLKPHIVVVVFFALAQGAMKSALQAYPEQVERSKHLRLPTVSVFVHDGFSARVAVNDYVPAEADAALHLVRPADERTFVVLISSAIDRAEEQPEQVLRELPYVKCYSLHLSSSLMILRCPSLSRCSSAMSYGRASPQRNASIHLITL